MIDEVDPTEIPNLQPTPESNRLETELSLAVKGPASPEDMHNRRVNFGKYKGERWTRVPVQWLRWCANQMSDPVKTLALLELRRRGTSPADTNMDISAHAIDRASLNLYDDFLGTAFEGEGLHSWLARISREAYDANDLPTFSDNLQDGRSKDVTVEHNHIKYIFMLGSFYPVLKTIHKA